MLLLTIHPLTNDVLILPMNPMVTIGEAGFTLTWSPVHDGSEYLVFLERCDRQHLATGGVDCERILSEKVTVATPGPTVNVAAVADSIQLVSEKVLDLCQFYYNVRIDALGAGARMVFRETAVLAKYAFQHSPENTLCFKVIVLRSPTINLEYNNFVTQGMRMRLQEPPRMRRESGGDSDRRAFLCLRLPSDGHLGHRLLPPPPASANDSRARPTAAHRPRPLEGVHPTLPEGKVRAPVGQEGVRGQGGGAASLGRG